VWRNNNVVHSLSSTLLAVCVSQAVPGSVSHIQEDVTWFDSHGIKVELYMWYVCMKEVDDCCGGLLIEHSAPVTPVLLFPVVSIFVSSPLATLLPPVLRQRPPSISSFIPPSSTLAFSLFLPLYCPSLPLLPPFLLPGSQPQCNRLPSPSLGVPLWALGSAASPAVYAALPEPPPCSPSQAQYGLTFGLRGEQGRHFKLQIYGQENKTAPTLPAQLQAERTGMCTGVVSIRLLNRWNTLILFVCALTSVVSLTSSESLEVNNRHVSW